MIFHGMLAGELIVSDGPLISLIITDSPPSDSSHAPAKPVDILPTAKAGGHSLQSLCDGSDGSHEPHR